MLDNVVDIQDLSVSYGSAPPVIQGFSLALGRGDRVGLAGESGCGKTTVLRAVTGLLPRSAVMTGAVRIAGQAGYIPQESLQSLSPFLRVGAQVTELTRSREETARLFARVGMSEKRFMDAYPHQLSGGERQRVLAIQALAVRPVAILADEPTSNLDPNNEAIILNLLEEYARESGAPILIASHRERVFERLSCRIRYVRPPNHGIPPCSPSERIRGEPLLTIRNLSKLYFRRDWHTRSRPVTTALDRVSVEIHSGECVAIAGPSGAGKSTLARCIAARERFDSGSIEWHVAGNLPERFQLVQQEPSESLNPGITIADAFREACGRADPDLLTKMRLPADWLNRKVSALSEGERARIAIARSVARLKNGLLILDESLSGLDRSTRGHILSFLRKQQKLGLTILLITHDVELAEELGARVLRMEAGRIATEHAATAAPLVQ